MDYIINRRERHAHLTVINIISVKNFGLFSGGFNQLNAHIIGMATVGLGTDNVSCECDDFIDSTARMHPVVPRFCPVLGDGNGGVLGRGGNACFGELASGSRHMIAVSNQDNAGSQLVMIDEFGGKNSVFAGVHTGVVADDGDVGQAFFDVCHQPRRLSPTCNDGQGVLGV